MSDTKTKGMEGGAPSPEVPPKARRRTFDAAYRQRILEEADRCSEVGQIGALLRREGLYSSQLTSWRRQRLAGGLGGLEPKRRGRKSRPPRVGRTDSAASGESTAGGAPSPGRGRDRGSKKNLRGVWLERNAESQRELIQAAEALAQDVGVSQATDVLSVPRATLYRHRQTPSRPDPPSRQVSPRALPADEQDRIRAVLYEERLVDKSPRQIYAALLDGGIYLCSVSTMYRLLARDKASRERRNQLKHPAYKKPELLACSPNQVWSWDITKLKGPQKWQYFQLYVILDIFSRYVVGWMLAEHESADLASRLIRETVQKQGVNENQLTIHSDRGAAMASLGVVKSHSRPHVSNDNPFSESQFKTLKYMPEFPDRFGSHADALSYCRKFFQWYNEEHYHTGIALLTPSTMHYGRAAEVIDQRQAVLAQAYAQNPQRFVSGPPVHAKVPVEVWINPPTQPPKQERLPEAHCP